MSAARPVFVLHEHDQPQHPFDLRLEENGPAPSAQESVEDAATTDTRPTGVAAAPGVDEVVPKVLAVDGASGGQSQRPGPSQLLSRPDRLALLGRLQRRIEARAPDKDRKLWVSAVGRAGGSPLVSVGVW